MAYDPNIVVTADNRHTVIAALIKLNHEAARLHPLNNIQLANLYHAQAVVATPSDLQRLANSIVVSIMEALGAQQPPALDEDRVRKLAAEVLEAQPARLLTVATARGSVTLDGVRHYMTEDVIMTVGLGHPVMLVGPAGSGKTTIGEHTAKALQLPFKITNVVSDTHELMGFVDGHGKYHGTPFRDAFEHGGVWIADEIDAWDASALLAANSALANGFASFPDRSEPLNRHDDFRMIATANTFGTGADRVYVGRNELDAASLDRFAVIEIDYDLTLERMFANGFDEWLDRVWSVRKTVGEKKIRHVVSSRAIAMGAAALNAGFRWSKVEDRYLFKGMSAKDRMKIDD